MSEANASDGKVVHLEDFKSKRRRTRQEMQALLDERIKATSLTLRAPIKLIVLDRIYTALKKLCKYLTKVRP